MYIDFFVRILFCIFFFFCCSIFMLVQKIPFSVHKFNCTLAHLFRSVHFECMSFCFVPWRAGQACFVKCYLGASTDIRCRSVVWLTFKMFGANIHIYNIDCNATQCNRQYDISSGNLLHNFHASLVRGLEYKLLAKPSVPHFSLIRFSVHINFGAKVDDCVGCVII